MRQDIHPKYEDTTITCACGEVIHIRSTKKNIRVEICSKCHPFFTGKQKLVDSAGRVEKFMKKYGSDYKAKPKKSKADEGVQSDGPVSKTLQDIEHPSES